jgi:L-alanine-DL-glutamate epimerase-like enolase superfamily enzyme
MRNSDGMKNKRSNMERREFLRMLGATTVGAAGITGIMGPFDFARAAISPGERGIKITNIAVATIRGLNSTGRVVRLDTNVGISGYGECRVEDNNAGTELNKCKPIVIGMNPTQVDKVFNAISDWRQITYAGGAVAGIECACWDITGKVYNLPIWKLLGPKLRDSMRLYADTWVFNSSEMQGEVDRRMNMGFTWFKTDLNFLGGSDYQNSPDPNPYGASGGSAKRILDSGITKWRDYTSTYRKIIGDYPLSADHFFNWSPSGSGNQLDVASAINVSNALGEKGYMDKSLGGWMEDIIPWHYYSELAEITAGTDMNILTGEDIFGVALLKELVDEKAIDYFHPDPCTFGGIHQSRLAAMYAHSKGVKTAFHQSNGPIATIMCAHISAGIPDFLCCEHHYPEISWYDDLIDGIPKPMLQKDGCVPIPDGPGLGITLNESAFRAHGTWFS